MAGKQRRADHADPTAREALADLTTQERERQRVPVSAVRPLIERWIGEHEDGQEAFERLALASGLKADTWRKRFSDQSWEGKRGTWHGWWSHETLDAADVDFLLACADLTYLWHTELAPWSALRSWLVCEDCGCQLNKENYRPLELMRADSEALHGWIRDATKQKWVYRPTQARAGGRRFRTFDLCRRCAGEALRQRAMSGSISVGGKKRSLRTKERVPPKRGGRPRLLTDRELRLAFLVYERGELSIRELAAGLHASGHKGSRSGLEQSLLYGWRRLGFPVRSRYQSAILRHRKLGHEIGRRAAQRANKRRCAAILKQGKRKGLRCSQWCSGAGEFCAMHSRHGTLSRSERRPRCSAITQDKKPCTYSPLPDSTLCRRHDPRFAEQRRKDARALRAGAERAMTTAATVQPVIAEYLRWLAGQPRSGRLGAPQRWKPLVEVSGLNHAVLKRIHEGPGELHIRKETARRINDAVRQLLADEIAEAAA